MTDHPCKGLSRAQRETFERIAINQPAMAGRRTIEALLAAGVVQRGPDEIRRDALGDYAVPYYFVPLGVHAQWCLWASEQPEGDGT